MQTVSQRWEQDWLPFYPLASDDLARGIFRAPRQKALGMRYIEANPQAVSNLLVIDCDHPDAMLRAVDGAEQAGHLPNFVIENPINGHAHVVWALDGLIPRTEYAHRKPIAFAAAVTEGLRRYLDGDKGYSGLMTKNPEHPSWKGWHFTDHLYTLGELCVSLDGYMPAPSWSKTRRKNPVGLGRNCMLFETARVWAYREVRNHWGDSSGLREAIRTEALTINLEQFAEPLPSQEVGWVADSIWRWITTKSRMWADGPAVYEATFITIQSARVEKRWRAAGEEWKDAEL